MKINKSLLILSMVLIVLLAIGTASASDTDDNTQIMEISDENEIETIDNIETADDTETLDDDLEADTNVQLSEGDDGTDSLNDDTDVLNKPKDLLTSDDESTNISTKTLGIYLDDEFISNISFSNNGNVSMNMSDMMELFSKVGLDNISSMFNMSNIDMSQFNMSSLNMSDLSGIFNVFNTGENGSDFYFSINGEVGIIKYNLLLNTDESEDKFDFHIVRLQDASVLTVKNMTIKPASGKDFTVNLKDSSGKALANKEVQIAIGTKIYKRTTDSEGNAKLKINLKNLGTYSVPVCFLGDDMSKAAFDIAKITVTNADIKEEESSSEETNSTEKSNRTQTLSIYLDNELFTNMTINGDGNSAFGLSANAKDLVNLLKELGLGDMANMINSSESSTFNVSNFDMSQLDFSNFDMSSLDMSSLGNYMGMIGMIGQSNASEKSNKTFNFKVAGEVGIIKYSMLLYLNQTDDLFDYSILRPQVASIISAKDMTTQAVNVNIDGKTGKNFTANLNDALGNPIANKEVQIGIDSKIYKRTTDSDGNVKIQINLAKAGKHTVSVAYLGDVLTAASFDVFTITVTKQTTKLTAPSKTYKASAKTKSLTATLKNSDGKALANKKVTFTVNGKTYTATTNSNGLATVKASLSKKGTYSFTAKFAGDNSYSAISKTSKLILK